jgi:hypothetical protein
VTLVKPERRSARNKLLVPKLPHVAAVVRVGGAAVDIGRVGARAAAVGRAAAHTISGEGGGGVEGRERPQSLLSGWLCVPQQQATGTPQEDRPT